MYSSILNLHYIFMLFKLIIIYLYMVKVIFKIYQGVHFSYIRILFCVLHYFMRLFPFYFDQSFLFFYQLKAVLEVS